MDLVRSELFWTLWAATGLVCVWQLIAAVKSPTLLVSVRFLASVIVLYFYVFMAFNAATSFAHELPEWAFELGQGIALASIVAFNIGCRLAARKKLTATAAPAQSYDAKTAWRLGLIVIVVGAGSYYAFMNQEVVDWQNTSAYWYYLYHLQYPGMTLCLLAMKQNPQFQTGRRWLVFMAVVAFAMLPHVMNARRGPLFPAVILFLFVPPLATGKVPSRTRVPLGLLAAGIAMLLFVQVRPWVYAGRKHLDTNAAGAAWSEALQSVSADDVIVKRARTMSDNEYLYHCAAIAANYEFEAYQYGTGLLSLLTHWVPRAWWPDKPRLGGGWFPPATERIPLLTGWALSDGAAIGGLAQSFNELGFACPLVWGLLGYGATALFRRARVKRTAIHIMTYIGLAGSMHWLLSQGLHDAFVPACLYLFVPFALLRVARARRRPVTASRPLPLPRGVAMAPGRRLPGRL